MNKAILIGRLTRDPDTRTTTSNVPVTTFTIAIDRAFKDASGNKQADFIPIVAWRKQSEFVAKYFHKGDRISIVGSIQTRSWDDTEGKRHSVTEVIADECGFIDSRKDAQTNVAAEEDPPFDI